MMFPGLFQAGGKTKLSEVVEMCQDNLIFRAWSEAGGIHIIVMVTHPGTSENQSKDQRKNARSYRRGYASQSQDVIKRKFTYFAWGRFFMSLLRLS